MQLYTDLLGLNMHNKDQLERLSFLDWPNDFRQKIWSMCLVTSASYI